MWSSIINPCRWYLIYIFKPRKKIAIIGESGAGKSTLLNLIAGFEYADSGEIWLNGENHTKTAPFERPVSMLFQENNLFTHLP